MIDPAHIGILGFSAGGHLPTPLSNQHEKQTMYPRVDEADDVSCRPDFTLLIYPAYPLIQQKGDKHTRTQRSKIHRGTHPRPSSRRPRTEVAYGTACSLFYYLALKHPKVPAQMHLYPKAATATACGRQPVTVPSPLARHPRGRQGSDALGVLAAKAVP